MEESGIFPELLASEGGLNGPAAGTGDGAVIDATAGRAVQIENDATEDDGDRNLFGMGNSVVSSDFDNINGNVPDEANAFESADDLGGLSSAGSTDSDTVAHNNKGNALVAETSLPVVLVESSRQRRKPAAGRQATGKRAAKGEGDAVRHTAQDTTTKRTSIIGKAAKRRAARKRAAARAQAQAASNDAHIPLLRPATPPFAAPQLGTVYQKYKDGKHKSGFQNMKQQHRKIVVGSKSVRGGLRYSSGSSTLQKQGLQSNRFKIKSARK